MLVERLREEVQRGEPFHRAVERVRGNVAFTTHTPVPAGNETFDADLARYYLGRFANEMGVETPDLLALGQIRPGGR